MRVRVSVIALGLLAIAGCASTGSKAPAPSPAPADDEAASAAMDPTLQTRVMWTPKCPHEASAATAQNASKMGLLGLILAAVAPKIIEGAVDSAATALKAAGEAKTLATSATTTANFYGVSQAADLSVVNSCLVVVKGKFAPDGKNTMADWMSYDQLSGLQSVLFLMEAKVEPLRGLKYFRLVPQYLAVNDFQERSLAHRKERDYTVAVSMWVPGGAQPFGSAEMSFQDLNKGTEIKDPHDWRLRGAASLPVAFPAESADATRAQAKREAQVAPFLLAMDILSTPEPMAEAAPGLYDPGNDPDNDPKKQPKQGPKKGVISAVQDLCSGIEAFNKDRAKQFQISDDRCAYEVDARKARLDVELKTANRTAARTAWANSICLNPEKKGGQVVKCKGPDPDPELKSAEFTYFTTQLTLSETREGSKFLGFLGTALGAAKTDVAGVIKDKLLPKTQAQKDADAEGARDVQNAVLLADLAVTQAEESLAAALLVEPPKPADVTAARIVLLKAKIDSNKAYRKANLPVRYPELG